MKPIRVVSSMPGSGKTTWVFSHIQERSDEKWIFVSPYLKECGGYDSAKDVTHIGRIKQKLPSLDFKNPCPKHGKGSKKESFKRYITEGHNVATTHQLWTMLDAECADIIAEQGYNLVIDESLNLVEPFEEFTSFDIELALRAGVMISADDGRLIWDDTVFSKNQYHGAMSELRQLCKIEALYLYGDEIVIYQVPPKIIQSADEIIVLTYGFAHSVMGAWCDVYNIPYYIDRSVNLYKTNDEIIQELRSRLNIIDIPKSLLDMDTQEQEQGREILHKTWYDERATEEDFKTLRNCFRSIVDNSFDDGPIFWTTFKDHKNTLQGKRYTRKRRVTLQGDSEESMTFTRDPFVPKNMRASNEYRDCTNCIYSVNVRMNPWLYGYLKSRGAETLSEDIYALLEMVQFLFRGAVRNQDNDPHYPNHMNVFIASPRMLALLRGWLHGEISVE